jgi:MFS family permease
VPGSGRSADSPLAIGDPGSTAAPSEASERQRSFGHRGAGRRGGPRGAATVIARLPTPILRDPAFARLWFIQASTQVGGNMALYALTVLVFTTTRSNATVSVLVMSFLVPPVLLSAAAGVLVDRLDVRVALIVPNLVRSLLTLALAVAGANVAVLLVLNLGVSLTSVVLSPAEASMIPRIVPKAQLETAMGIFSMTLQASFAMGFALLGPLLVALAGPSLALVVVTGFYAAATVATLGLPSAPPVVVEPGIARRAMQEPIRQLREGFAAISGDREVSRPLMHLTAAASVVGVIGVLGPSLALSLGLDPRALIVIVLPLGLGVVGGVAGLRWFGAGLSRRRAAETGLIVFGLLAIGISTAGAIGSATGLPVIPPVVVLAFCAGAAYAATTVSAQTALFEHMPPAIRGRIFGVLTSIVSAASLIAVLIAGPLADATSAQLVVVVTSVGVIALAAWSTIVFGPRSRRDGMRA